MKIAFTKMHGIGNDFIVIDCRDKILNSRLSGRNSQTSDLSALSRRLCDRRFGIGADQILLLEASATADFAMKIFNADGSEVEMCGNGIRCLAKYIWDRGLSEKAILAIETPAGIIRPERAGEMVRVDMGEPVLEGRMIPAALDGRITDMALRADDREFKITCVSMGNPHAVIVVDDVDAFDVHRYGPVIEQHPFFPKRVNVEFIQVLGPESIRMRVWERGSGETLACGTGASAVGVAANILGLTEKKTTVHLRGGDLLIEWAGNNHVYMTGPAVDVFEGLVRI
ncbi:MAG: diaminopimelate epimerase [Thermodesulfovibrionales bacterium]